jgi:hypothetical protein
MIVESNTLTLIITRSERGHEGGSKIDVQIEVVKELAGHGMLLALLSPPSLIVAR